MWLAYHLVQWLGGLSPGRCEFKSSSFQLPYPVVTGSLSATPRWSQTSTSSSRFPSTVMRIGVENVKYSVWCRRNTSQVKKIKKQTNWSRLSALWLKGNKLPEENGRHLSKSQLTTITYWWIDCLFLGFPNSEKPHLQHRTHWSSPVNKDLRLYLISVKSKTVGTSCAADSNR